ncbi:hypothetical protein WT94_25090 [Burkholderia stagnalis]|nr:hypothetical protein WT76_06060 [Burkholderia stagnalis]KWO18411.1 hypothetical protein WT94_25090 [Burkholderia stagnalis]
MIRARFGQPDFAPAGAIIWRTFACARGSASTSNLPDRGSKRASALALHSLSQTMSRSSTKIA